MPGTDYVLEPIDAEERVLGVFYGGRGQVGQKFVVTNRRLLMGPLDTELAVEVGTWVLGKAGVGGMDVLKKVLAGYGPMKPRSLALPHIAEVRATNNASLFKAPGLRIASDDGEVIELGIVRKPTAPSIDPRNNASRDQLASLLQQSVAAVARS